MSQLKDTILTVRDLRKSFGGVHAVQDAHFTLHRGGITGLIGPNGAGKTTAFNMITGLVRPDSGEIIYNGLNITHWPTWKRAQAGLTRTFQAIRLFPQMTVKQNLEIALRMGGQKQTALELLESVDLEDKGDLFAGELSYGQQKIIEILRVIAIDPELILLDEPAAGVNPTMLRKIIDLIYTLQKQGKSLLIIEHDMGFIMEICEKIIVMDYGKEIAMGTPNEVQKDPKVLEAYLGRG